MNHTSISEEAPPRTGGLRPRKAIFWPLVGLLALCGWVFFLGVLVGRGTAPIEFDLQALESKLQSLRQQILREQESQLQAYSEGSGPPSDLEFYEALKGAQEAPRIKPDTVANMERAADGAAAPLADADTGVKRPRAGLKPKLSARPAPVPSAASTPAAAPAPAGPPAAAPAAQGPLAIQVASLQEADRADQMVQRLRAQGFAAYKATVTIPGKGVWYRIRVGSFQHREEAAATLQGLEARGLHPILVPR
jgi:cell division septation protein DedD